MGKLFDVRVVNVNVNVNVVLKRRPVTSPLLSCLLDPSSYPQAWGCSTAADLIPGLHLPYAALHPTLHYLSFALKGSPSLPLTSPAPDYPALFPPCLSLPCIFKRLSYFQESVGRGGADLIPGLD
jgi:hypothetical protein